MALRVLGTTSSIAGTGFNSGFGSGARGHSVFAWLRRGAADQPRVGLFGPSATRSNVGLNGASPRGVITDAAAVNLLPSAGTVGVGVWAPVALSVKDLGANRQAAICFASTGAATVATSATFNLSTTILDSFGIGRELSAVTALLGDYAHAAVWDAALDDNEMRALCGGANPLTIRRGALQAYFPLDTDFRNLANPVFKLTPNSAAPTWVDGPTIIRRPPAPPRVFLLRSTATAGSTLSGGTTGRADTGAGSLGVRVTLSGGATGRADTGTGSLGVRVTLSGGNAERRDTGGGIGLSTSIGARTFSGGATGQADLGGGIGLSTAIAARALSGGATGRADTGGGMGLSTALGTITLSGGATERRDNGSGLILSGSGPTASGEIITIFRRRRRR